MENIIIKNNPILLGIVKELNAAREKTGQSAKSPFDYMNSGFTKAELDTITVLKIQANAAVADFSGLEQIANLSNLEISYQSDRGFLADRALKDKEESTKRQTDYSAVEKCKNLETLRISDQPSLEKLDVGNMEKLDTLEIRNNNKMRQVTGLENLTQLLELTMCGSCDLESFDFGEIRKNNPNLSNCTFDLSMFPGFMKKCINFPKEIAYDTNHGETFNMTETKFIERHSHASGSKNDYAKINGHRALKTYEKAQKVISEVTSPECTDYENFYGLYKWVIQNISYDHEGLAETNGKTPQTNGVQNVKIAEFMNKDMDDIIRSSFYALDKGKVVCAGYANLMVLLGRMANIDISYVSCNGSGKKHAEGSLDTDHAIIKTRFGNKVYYSDPTWDAENIKQNKISHFMRSKDEIMETHNLSYLEASEANSNTISKEDRQFIVNNYEAKMQKQKQNTHER